MAEEFSARTLEIIGAMVRASATLPDDFLGVAVAQELAVIAEDLEHFLTQEQFALLVGTGAYIMKITRDETIAGIEAMIALSKARGANNG